MCSRDGSSLRSGYAVVIVRSSHLGIPVWDNVSVRQMGLYSGSTLYAHTVELLRLQVFLDQIPH